MTLARTSHRGFLEHWQQQGLVLLPSRGSDTCWDIAQGLPGVQARAGLSVSSGGNDMKGTLHEAHWTRLQPLKETAIEQKLMYFVPQLAGVGLDRNVPGGHAERQEAGVHVGHNLLKLE